jgi:hypothetical protein
MFGEINIDFFAALINSALRRRPIVLEAKDKASEPVLKHIMSFFPSHRYFLVAGAAPKWAKYLPSQPRQLKSDDLSELSTTIQSVMEEERLGRRPVQLIYFGANSKTYKEMLSTIPNAWVAVTDNLKDIIRSLPVGESTFSLSWDGIRSLHIGEAPENLDFENRLLQRLRGRRHTVATFMVQKKFAEINLAGEAVRQQIEDGEDELTMVELEELFDLDTATSGKMFEMSEAEYGFDIRRYISLPSSEVESNLDRLAESVGHAVAICAILNEKLIAIRRLRASELDISTMARIMAQMLHNGRNLGWLGGGQHLRIIAMDGSAAIAVSTDNTTYVVFLDREGKPALALSSIYEVLA